MSFLSPSNKNDLDISRAHCILENIDSVPMIPHGGMFSPAGHLNIQYESPLTSRVVDMHEHQALRHIKDGVELKNTENIDGLLKDCVNFNMLAMELPQSCTVPSKYNISWFTSLNTDESNYNHQQTLYWLHRFSVSLGLIWTQAIHCPEMISNANKFIFSTTQQMKSWPSEHLRAIN